MKNSEWKFLSYELSPALSNYGGANGIHIEWIRRIDKGDSSNNSTLQLAAHTGTHIDYPFHFLANGKKGNDYNANELVFYQCTIVDIHSINPKNFLITPNDLEQFISNSSSTIELILFKTGFCYRRDEESYWKYNWGFAPECAGFLKTKFPRLRAIGFDLISLSSYQQRETGRLAHKEFLGTHNLLIVEDMDLRNVSADEKFSLVIISPLRFTNADGSPVTVWAKPII
ncbi:MAG: cyclase family protein [Flavobacteriales bacterium]|nr:cyclase family protein [Flavobacteriales bacterium]